jgi:hypothetical protein
VGAAIYTADPAAIRARLLAELCVRHGLALVDTRIAFLTGGPDAGSPWLRGYEVLRVLPLRPAGLAAEVRALRPSAVRVHCRGVAVTAPDLERRLARAADARGGGPVLDVFATRALGETIAAVTRRSDAR